MSRESVWPVPTTSLDHGKTLLVGIEKEEPDRENEIIISIKQKEETTQEGR